MYFVMLNHPTLPAVPMTPGDDDSPGDAVAFFTDFEDAKAAAENNMLGEAYGFDVFMLGNGEI